MEKRQARGFSSSGVFCMRCLAEHCELSQKAVLHYHYLETYIITPTMQAVNKVCAVYR